MPILHCVLFLSIYYILYTILYYYSIYKSFAITYKNVYNLKITIGNNIVSATLYAKTNWQLII